MTLVSISGACSRSGKTAAAVSLLRALSGGRAVAVKFTTTEDVFERCPRGTTCVVCDIDVPFRIVDDPAVLDEAGTDTARLRDAGAARVVWVIARESAVAPAWAAVQPRLGGADVIVMEGSTITAVARPDRQVFVAHPWLSPERWKPTSAACIAQADVVVVNRPRSEDRPPSPEVMDALRRHRRSPQLTIADVTAPPSEWAPELMRDLARARDAAAQVRA
jgi:molybdopterin-guanine dinucleotide biosynthesis protein